MLEGKLTIDGKEYPLSAEYSVAFYHPEGGLAPTLYRKGRRVTKAWTLELKVDEPADPWGGNGNTSD